MEEFKLEIIEQENDVTYDIPQVRFPAYEEYRDKATAVAQYISGMDVTEENVKEAKATLAKARKLTDKLTRARIDMKKAILQNYTIFESQVKEIVDIIAEADSEVRGKVRELEEAERVEKRAKILELWQKRVPPYDAGLLDTVVPDAFEKWMKPKYLNKTTSMKTVETEMTAWIQQTLKDIKAAQAMGDDYLEAYAWTGDLAKAVEQVKAAEEMREALDSLGADTETEEPTTTFLVYGDKDGKLAEMLLKENNINYTKL